MNDKEMVKHIKELTRVIERQAEYAQQMNATLASINRIIASILLRLGRLEGFKNDE